VSAAVLDAGLVARARAASGKDREAACREIYESLRPRVFRVCLQLCGERTLAEDAMQNAFLAAFRGLRTFRGDAQLSTWIYRVAIREALALRARRAPARSQDRSRHPRRRQRAASRRAYRPRGGEP